MEKHTSPNAAKAGWGYLKRELITRTTEPAKNPQFVIYVVGAIGLMGALGIWIEIIKLLISETQPVDLSSLNTALVTFFLALIASSAFQLNFSSTGERDKVFASVAVFFLVMFFAIAGLLTWIGSKAPAVSLFFAAICALCAVWIFWISNGSDPVFQSTPAVDDPTGGNPARSLHGDTNGYKV